MKKKIRGLSFVLPVLIMIAGAKCGMTSAYFSAYDAKNNITSVAHNDTLIEEEFPIVTPTPISQNPKYTKKVWVSNKSTSLESILADCYVRVRISYSNADIGAAVQLLGLNTVDWIKEEDGFYYYKKVLRKNENTSALISGYQIDSSKVEDEYKKLISDFEVNVYEESVQAEGFADYREAFGHFGG